MYSWGNDTSNWKSPGAYSYDDAKSPYLEDLANEAKAKGPKKYFKKKEPDMKVVDPKNKTIKSTSKNPVLFWIDGTGSTQDWPEEVYDRTSLFYQTLAQQRDDVEIGIAVFGDANYDKFPVQIPGFATGVEIDAHLQAVHGEGGGGPGIRESPELMAYFALEHCETPNADRPYLFVFTDEKFYDQVSASQVETHFGDQIQGDMDASTLWKRVNEEYNVKLLFKPLPGRSKEVLEQWGGAIGLDNIYLIKDKTRIIDQALGIIAQDWGFEADFQQSLAARQSDGVIADVQASLRPLSVLLSQSYEAPVKKSASLLAEDTYNGN